MDNLTRPRAVLASRPVIRRRSRAVPVGLALLIALAGMIAVPGIGLGRVHAASAELLGSWTVRFVPSSLNGNGRNIRRPAQLIHGTVISPGESFDFARATGPFTKKNGYSSGGAIVGGVIKPDAVIGGGLCSAATAMFNAAARAGLKINQRNNHTFYISRYPVGLDATIWVNNKYRGKNVIFTNDSGHPLTIRGITGRKFVTFEIWGVSDGRKTNFTKPHISNPRYAGAQVFYSDKVRPGKLRLFISASSGFDSVVQRTVTGQGGVVLHEDTYRSHYRPEDAIYYLGRRAGDPPAGTRVPDDKLPNLPPPPPTPPPSSPTPKPSSPTASPSPTPSASPTPTATETATATPTETATATTTPTDDPLPTP